MGKWQELLKNMAFPCKDHFDQYCSICYADAQEERNEELEAKLSEIHRRLESIYTPVNWTITEQDKNRAIKQAQQICENALPELKGE